MTETYELWLNEVRDVLLSINMPLEEWQSLWPFAFSDEYKAGTTPADAAEKANRFWWHRQNKSLKRECRITQGCWLPHGHRGTCQPVS